MLDVWTKIIEIHMEPKVVLKRLRAWDCDRCTAKFYRSKDLHKHAASHNNLRNSEHALSNQENIEKRLKCEYCGSKRQQESNLISDGSGTFCKCKTNSNDTQLVQNNVYKHKFILGSKYNKLKTFTKPESTKTDTVTELTFRSYQNEKSKSSGESVPDPLSPTRVKNIKTEIESRKKCLEEAVYDQSISRFTCGQCPKTFKRFETMSTHLIDHSGPPYVCMKCPETFESIALRNQHTRNGHKYEFECSTCHKKFKNNGYLKVHLRVHTGERPYHCELCGKRFTQTAALYTHNKIHLGIKEHVCSFCNKSFIDYYNMKNHERIHTQERPFICKYCKRAFTDPSALKRHERTHTGDKRYQCEQCPMKFTDASGLIAHKRRHNGIKKFNCECCAKNFFTRSELIKHESAMHIKSKPFECDVCAKRFTLKQYLAGHIIRSHLPSVQCRSCELKFFSKMELQQHLSKGCVKDRFGCDICGKKVPQKSILKTHMEKKHCQALYCHICLKRFYTEQHLQKHKAARRCTKIIYVEDIKREITL